MNTFSKILFCAGLSGLALIGCSSTKELPLQSAEHLYDQAMAKYDDRDYLDAINDFKTITVQYPGSAFADKAEFYMGECRFKREEFILAAAEFDILIRTMPSSPLVPRARFEKAMSYYELSPKAQLDQKYSLQAVDEFQAYIEYSPQDSLVPVAEKLIAELNDKLAKKEYESAMLYFKLEYYRAAIVYFDYVLEHYHDTEYADEAMLGKARAQYGRHDYDGALATLKSFADRFPSSGLRQDAEKLRKEVLKDRETSGSADQLPTTATRTP